MTSTSWIGLRHRRYSSVACTLEDKQVEGVLWTSGAVALHSPDHPGVMHSWVNLPDALNVLGWTDDQVQWIDSEAQEGGGGASLW